MDNILANNKFILDDFNPEAISRKIARNLKLRRLELNLTQRALAKKSGVSFGSLKRFESISEISLKNLLRLAVVLQASEGFLSLFELPAYRSVDDVIQEKKQKTRKRGRKND